MNVIMKACAIACIGLAAQSAIAANASGLGQLISKLSQLHDQCSDLAKKSASKHASDQYQLALDLQNKQLQAQMDAQVYGVGHGSRETSEYLIQRMQDAQTANDQSEMKIRKAYQDDAQSVAACVRTAESDGKDAYIDFKASKRVAKVVKQEGESLMASWLTNLREITIDAPQGSSATAAEWKTAKAHAELTTL